MTYITTNEAAKLWHITPRRVAMLAAQGRISGAKCVENRWFIPADAEKPSDSRKKAKIPLSRNNYVFPNIPYTICNDHPVESLDPEEKELYDAFMLYEAGEIEQGITAVNGLLKKTKRLYIRIGALYNLVFLNILAKKYEEASSAMLHFYDCCAKANEHSSEITLLTHELESYCVGKDWLKNSFSVSSLPLASDFEIAYASFLCGMQDTVRVIYDKADCPINIHELTLIRLEKAGYWFMSMLYHLFISTDYASKEDDVRERYHLEQAFRIAAEHGTYTSLASFVSFSPNLSYTILSDYPEEIKAKFTALMELNSSTAMAFFKHLGNSTLLSKLSGEDYILISYCMRNHTLKKISEEMHISLSKAKKLMVALCKKVGVKGKAELIKTYTDTLETPAI